MVFDHPILVAAKVAVLLLGVSVAAVSFLSYRRTGRRLMLFLAFAFALIALGSFAEGVSYEFLGLDLATASAVESVLVLCGLAMLAVALRPREVRT